MIVMCPYAQYLYGGNQGDLICTANNALNVCCMQRDGTIPNNLESKCERKAKRDGTGSTDSNSTEVRHDER